MKRRRLRIRRILVLLIIIILAIVLIKSIVKSQHNVSNLLEYVIPQKSEYEIIKLDKNENYAGIGQQKVSNKDGYFSTFTTVDSKTYIEYKQNGNSSWSKSWYWNDYMENTGCGITAMAIILSGYNKKQTPEDLRQKYYPVINYDTLDTEFFKSYNLKSSGFFYDSVHLSKNNIQKHLLTNRPVLICVWDKPNANRWTTSSHYLVLLASDNDNLVYVSNPNGGENDSKSSGWYDYDEVVPYIAKALYIESY